MAFQAFDRVGSEPPFLPWWFGADPGADMAVLLTTIDHQLDMARRKYYI